MNTKIARNFIHYLVIFEVVIYLGKESYPSRFFHPINFFKVIVKPMECPIIYFDYYYFIMIRNYVVFLIQEKLVQIYMHIYGYEKKIILFILMIIFGCIDSKFIRWIMFIRCCTSSLGWLFSTCGSIFCLFSCFGIINVCEVRRESIFKGDFLTKKISENKY